MSQAVAYTSVSTPAWACPGQLRACLSMPNVHLVVMGLLGLFGILRHVSALTAGPGTESGLD
jgi:hypothetical protein